MLVQWWVSIANGGPTLDHHGDNISSLLGRQVFYLAISAQKEPTGWGGAKHSAAILQKNVNCDIYFVPLVAKSATVQSGRDESLTLKTLIYFV